MGAHRIDEEDDVEKQLAYTKVLTGTTFEEARERVIAGLKEQGFGVITEIDVKKTLKEKIDVDFRRYTILGACQPKIAHAALTADPEIGVLLPCNVVVYEDGDDVVVKLCNPRYLFTLLGNRDVATLVDEVDARIRHVRDHL
jgi:uncharacterized protein (DUF302 family)